MTVYVVQQPTPNKHGWQPDLSSAAQYGAIKFCFDSTDKVYALPGPSLFKARKMLRDFDYENDYILWPNLGDPMAMAAFMLALKDINMNYVTFLQWSRKREEDGTRDVNNGFYVPITFRLIEANKGFENGY